ncbi:MAG: FHA domain-containing protein [Zoogloeaceae bacterium]|nr:FHA domain-containing protein [Rhodocyclaceae bacterium]MCP5241031.1 FHA domain-containing protein [Zoogloeaceae bacterium]MCP5255656.1 FHA domain-containing protein [Zoogloeaceae bacterium]MCP5294651.1 FHA domain-containing protein [Zoogloeaceae bacterium]MCW5616504.1 FHA domain-containing protein [Rhodocyclaceae bacterium]
MPKLILSMDGLVLKEIVLNKERISIGRKAHNDIQIDNLAISGSHAVITTILDDAFLEDQNSTNGTYVNGQPVKKHALQNNDVVELGKYRIKYVKDSSAPALNPSEFVDTASLKPLEIPSDRVVAHTPEVADSTDQHIDATATQVVPHGMDADVQPTRSAAPEFATQTGVIQVLSGSNAGRELVLTKSLTTLGKPGQQVAVITRRPHGYFITHVEGSSFPLVNGKALDAQARLLNEQDVIEIAGVKMSFFFREPG